MEISSNKIQAIWHAIENELLGQFPNKRIEEMLLPAAKLLQIDDLEQSFGMTLPIDYKFSLNVHEGTVYWVWLWDAVSFLSIHETLDFWKVNIDASSHPNHRYTQLKSEGAVRTSMFDPLWLPFANDNGIPICIDMNPAMGGSVGQIIYVDWEDGINKIIADNFVEFLEAGLAKMESKI